MRRAALAALVAAVAAAVAGAAAGPAAATTECRGLQICVSVVGPWVLVPASAGAPRREAEFQLSCPRRFVIGGLDAELSDRRLAVKFDGALGSPVTPGVTTSTAAVFRGVWTGVGAGAAPSFRPRLGCIPANGGGGGVPTSLQVFPPGPPPARHVKTLPLRHGLAHVTVRCGIGERLVAGAHAVGFYTVRPPTAALAAEVRAAHVLRPTALVATLRVGALHGAQGVLQAAAVCAGGR